MSGILKIIPISIVARSVHLAHRWCVRRCLCRRRSCCHRLSCSHRRHHLIKKNHMLFNKIDTARVHCSLFYSHITINIQIYSNIIQ